MCAVDTRTGTGTAAAGGDLAGVAAACGRTHLAERLARAAIAGANRTGDSWSSARALHSLSEILAGRGDPSAAGTRREALAAWTELRVPGRMAQLRQAPAHPPDGHRHDIPASR